MRNMDLNAKFFCQREVWNKLLGHPVPSTASTASMTISLTTLLHIP